MWVGKDNYCGLEIEGLKVVDIAVGNGYAGCRCQGGDDRNKYDKESKTIICSNYSQCLKDVLKQLPEHKRVQLKEYIKAYADLR